LELKQEICGFILNGLRTSSETVIVESNAMVRKWTFSY